VQGARAISVVADPEQLQTTARIAATPSHVTGHSATIRTGRSAAPAGTSSDEPTDMNPTLPQEVRVSGHSGGDCVTVTKLWVKEVLLGPMRECTDGCVGMCLKKKNDTETEANDIA